MNRVVDVEIWALTLFSPMIFIVITHCAVCLCDCLDTIQSDCTRRPGFCFSDLIVHTNSNTGFKIMGAENQGLKNQLKVSKSQMQIFFQKTNKNLAFEIFWPLVSSKRNENITKYKPKCNWSQTLPPCNYKWIVKWYVKYIWWFDKKRRNDIDADVIEWNRSCNFA